MSKPFIFDYNNFYKYYTDKKNLLVDSNPPATFYYKTFSNKLYTETNLKHYISIDNVRFYITTINNDRLLFTFPQLIDGKYWDFHYHFGINPNFSRNNIKGRAIFFHRTEQIPASKTRRMDNCYFLDKTPITEVADILCVQQAETYMGNKFQKINEVKYIQEIISRPFLGIQLNGGNNKSCRRRYSRRSSMKKRKTIKHIK
jgi:hypothetical protein